MPHPAVVRAGPAGLVAVTSYPGNTTTTVLDATDPRAPRTVARVGGLDESADIAFDAAGRTVAVIDGAQARIWDAATGRNLLGLHTQGLRLNSPRLSGADLTVLDSRSAMWRIKSDLAGVIAQTCARPVTVDWNRHFPDTARRQVCPPR